MVSRHQPTRDDIDHEIRRLFKARTVVPEVRQDIADRIADAATPGQGQGGGSGISDPTGAALKRITGLQDKDRAILRAIGGLRKAIDHLELECARGLGKHETDTSSEPRCPVMVLSTTEAAGEVLAKCGELTASKVDERGLPIGWDDDGYCVKHRAEADGAADEERRARHAEIARKSRRVA